MKKILVIGSVSSDEAEAKSLTDMVQFVEKAVSVKQPVEVYGCHLDEVGYYIDSSKIEVYDLHNDTDIAGYDFVFFRGKLAASINIASTIALYLTKHKIPHVNTAYSNRRAVGKIPQMLQLSMLGLPLPKTVSANAANLKALIDKHLEYPVIVKDVKGAHGNDNYLVKNETELQEILERSPSIDFMAQEFIENDGDYRVLIIGSKTAIIHRKGSDGSHLNNTSAGAQATEIDAKDFPAVIIEQSHIFAKSCQYEISGVDAIIDKNTGKHYFLEINSQPQLMTGAFVDKKLDMIGEYFNELLGQSE